MKPDWKQMIVVLIFGIVLGVLGTLRCMPFGFHGAWGNPEKFHQHMMAEFTSKLKLTSDQQQKVSAVLDESRVKISALREEVHPKFEAIRNVSKAEIRKLLTSEQQEKFDQLEAKWESTWKKKRTQWSEK